jgi:putative transcriptional regulator
MTLKNLNIEKAAKAIEADAGQPLPDLRQALQEANDIRAAKATGRVTTHAQVLI